MLQVPRVTPVLRALPVRLANRDLPATPARRVTLTCSLLISSGNGVCSAEVTVIAGYDEVGRCQSSRGTVADL